MFSSELGCFFQQFSLHILTIPSFISISLDDFLISDAFTWSVCVWHMVCHHGPFCIYLIFLFCLVRRWMVPAHSAKSTKLLDFVENHITHGLRLLPR